VPPVSVISVTRDGNTRHSEEDSESFILEMAGGSINTSLNVAFAYAIVVSCAAPTVLRPVWRTYTADGLWPALSQLLWTLLSFL
jgi:hypothetical protein